MIKRVVVAFAISFAATASGMLIGYSLRDTHVRAVALEQPSPPIEPGVTVEAPTLVLRTATPKASPSYVHPRVVLHRALTFFDFERASCDRAESVYQSVLRCSYARADRR